MTRKKTNFERGVRATSDRLISSRSLRHLADPVEIRDGLKSGKLVEQGGVVLETTPSKRGVPVSVAFTGIAYLRKLAGHRRRLRVIMDELRAEDERIESQPTTPPTREESPDERLKVCAGAT